MKEDAEEWMITQIEAKMWQKVLFCFHKQATDLYGSECTFWNDMCGIRNEYLKELEAIDE